MRYDITLRALLPQDSANLVALSAAFGWPHRQQDWVMCLSLGAGLAACGPNGAVVGTAMFWRWSEACATVGMVMVAPSHQGGGLGTKLMSAVLEASPAPAVMLNATLAGLGLYERFGFRPEGTVRQHQGHLATSVPAPIARLGAEAALSDLVALDRAGFGVSRASLMEWLMSTGELRVLMRGAVLCGFAVRRAFGHGDAIGPVVAETEDDAIALVGGLLRPGFQRIDIPAEATALAAWLARCGLPAVDSVTVMTRGAWPRGDGRMRRFALASQAFG